MLSEAQRLTLASALAGLGDTPDAVAASLAAVGATGPRREYDAGPIPAYLNGLLAAADLRPLRWTVTYTTAVGEYPARSGPPAFPVARVIIRLPPAVGAFLQAFDAGYRPASDRAAVRD